MEAADGFLFVVQKVFHFRSEGDQRNQFRIVDIFFHYSIRRQILGLPVHNTYWKDVDM